MPNPYQYVAPTRRVGQVSSLIAGNRLEPRPRSVEFNRSLRAEVRDASWLLARQWQMKEFRAEDRGSPIKAKVDLQHAPLTQLRLGNATSVTPYDRMALPLDAVVQAEPPMVDVALQLQMGRHWKRLLQSKLPAQATGLLATYRSLFPITAPTVNPALPYDLTYALAQTQPEAFAVRTTVAGQAIAGYDLYTWLSTPNYYSTTAFTNLTTGLTPDQKTFLRDLATEFIAWFRRTYSLPANLTNAWSVPDLAYKFAAAAPAAGANPIVVKTAEHFGEELNWYTVDEDTTAGSSGFQNPSPPPSPQTLHFVPTEIQFPGAPNARWWEFEDRKIDFGRITGDSSDFGRMLLQEFMFLYTNDWFSLPYTVPAGSICSVNNLVVTDVFGEQYRIKPAGQNANLDPSGTNVPLENDWGRWSLFGLSRIGNRQSSAPRLLLPPTALNTQVGPAVEQVYFAREEATNLVWGVEKIIPNGMGRGTDGDNAAARVADFLRSQAQPKPLHSGAELEYKLATAVAENWIPFIPRPTANLYELEQGAMLRHVDYLTLNTADETVQPRTSLLGRPANVPYLVHEREIPPTGMRLEGSFRRTRWYNGGTALWYGRNRNVGRSGGSSGLAYDQLFNRPPGTGTSTGGSSTAANAPALGVVSVNRTASGDIASVQVYRLDSQNQPVGNLIEYSGEQLVDLLLNEQSVVVIQPVADQLWKTESVLSIAPSGETYVIQESPIAWSPAQLGDILAAWYAPDSAVRSSTERVSQWLDKTANHCDSEIRSDEQAPFYQEGSIAYRGNRFEGTGQVIDVSTERLKLPQPFSVVVRARIDGNANAPYASDYLFDKFDNSRTIITNNGGGNDDESFYFGVETGAMYPVVIPREQWRGQWRTYGLVIDGENSAAYLDGKQIATHDVGSAGLNGLRFGANGGGEHGLNGELPEALVCRTALLPDQMEQIHLYLASKHA